MIYILYCFSKELQVLYELLLLACEFVKTTYVYSNPRSMVKTLAATPDQTKMYLHENKKIFLFDYLLET